MLPVVTPAEMAQIDAEADVAVETLVERAGAAVAREALSMLGGAYGRRVVVVAGKGNNGWDGRVAGRILSRRGVRVDIRDAAAPGEVRAGCDLLIDAAYGTGFRGTYASPTIASDAVLAVDIPSGVDGLTGVASGRPVRADRTVTFAALKPGLLYGDGPGHAGEVRVADIGLDTSRAAARLVEDADVVAAFPRRAPESHKWRAAVWVVGGSPNMPGAAALSCRGAFAAGAGYVRVSTPGADVPGGLPLEAVGARLGAAGWHAELVDAARFGSVVLGPGLGRSATVQASVVAAVASVERPMVVDGDALWAIADLRGRMSSAPRVLTPHDGECVQLTGHPPGADRIDAARRLAADRSAVVVLKGPTTTVAAPDGRVRIVTSGDERLATAGSGDVLSGVIGALLASGADPFDAAALGAHVHGRAGGSLPPVGGTASDLPAAVSAVCSGLLASGGVA